ncbi:hypothetical protein NKI44_18350 [Mesorhizobium sp. M0614]
MDSLAMGQSAAGSQGGIGDAAASAASTDSQVWVKGASSYAMFGQSATGAGNAHAVDLTAGDSLFAQGADSVAVYGESTAKGAKGNITINLNGQYTIGGAGTGVAAMLVGGADNNLINHSLLYAMGATPSFTIQASQFQAFQAFLLAPGPVVPTNAILESLLDDFSPLAITGTSGDDHVENSKIADTLGRVIGNMDLGGGTNSFHNIADASMVGLKTIDLGGGKFTNDGLFTNQGIGVVAKVDVTGGFTQIFSGDFVTDVDLNNQITDALALTVAGDFDGEAPLNFLSIDKLFAEYVLATGSAMTDSGITPTTLHPAVGFNFLTKVVGGTDLVLYADNPTFLELAQDPNSGTTDPGVFQMAQYLDDVEASSSPDNPMALLINMLRFLPDEMELGAALTRLTPHYAVHTFEMINRSTDIMLEAARECTGVPAYKDPDGRCVWASISPQAEYSRDAGGRNHQPRRRVEDDVAWRSWRGQSALVAWRNHRPDRIRFEDRFQRRASVGDDRRILAGVRAGEICRQELFHRLCTRRRHRLLQGRARYASRSGGLHSGRNADRRLSAGGIAAWHRQQCHLHTENRPVRRFGAARHNAGDGCFLPAADPAVRRALAACFRQGSGLGCRLQLRRQRQHVLFGDAGFRDRYRPCTQRHCQPSRLWQGWRGVFRQGVGNRRSLRGGGESAWQPRIALDGDRRFAALSGRRRP